MTHYVLTFIFSRRGGFLLCIKKLRPEWQKGNWNVPGGHVEPGEASADAAARELEEETGLRIFPDELMHFGKVTGSDFVLDLYVGTHDHLMLAKTVTDEEVQVFPLLDTLRPEFPCDANFRWLALAAWDAYNDGRPKFINVEYP